MKLLFILSQQDLRTTFRDPIFKGLLFFPLLAFAFIRWLLPVIIVRFPILLPYQAVILMWSCMQSATMFGFIYGFLFLDEKEENLFQVLRIVPISTLQLLASRLLVGFAVSSFTNFLLLHLGGIGHFKGWQEVLLALQFSLLAPLIALLLGIFSRNKVEGLAQMKIVNIALNLPALIYFLPSPWLHLTAIFPSYWSFRSLEAAATDGPYVSFMALGTAYYLIILYTLNRRFRKTALQ
jgi:fluoroquinolone transport system permease protein